MIISSKQVQQVLEAYGKKDASVRKRKAAKIASENENEPVQAARQVIGKSPEVREERVKELKDSIRTGQYDRSGEEIASKMISRSLVDHLIGKEDK